MYGRVHMYLLIYFKNIPEYLSDTKFSTSIFNNIFGKHVPLLVLNLVPKTGMLKAEYEIDS
eukprot:SAG31_NODE_3459_length_4250_cov_1.437244_1_plen_61_part_00